MGIDKLAIIEIGLVVKADDAGIAALEEVLLEPCWTVIRIHPRPVARTG